MPIVNGPQDLFVVGVTGNVLPDDVDHFLSCGADAAVLPKPIQVDPELLGTFVDGFWNCRRSWFFLSFSSPTMTTATMTTTRE